MRAWGRFELDWYFESKADADGKQGVFDPIYEAGGTQEQIDFTVETFTAFLERLEVRWADGRKHAAGNDVTAADFSLLGFYTSTVVNPGLYSPQIGERLLKKIEDDLPNTNRVINNIKKPLRRSIEMLPATGTYF